MKNTSHEDTKKVAHVFMSPAGSTRKAGRKICSLLEELGYGALELDLSRYRDRDGVALSRIEESSLLLVGSPVYADHAVYPVVDFLGKLPLADGKPALAYVTFGGVSKGSALYQLSRLLDKRGYTVIGLAAVLAVHSMMFRDDEPVAAGHPDEEDYEVLRRWLEELSVRLESGQPDGLDYRKVRPHRKLDRLMEATLITSRFMKNFWPRIRYSPERCNLCGICQKKCPVGRLDDLPRIDRRTRCLHCYQCVRYCPEDAFDAPMWVAHHGIRAFRRLSSMRTNQATHYYV